MADHTPSEAETRINDLAALANREDVEREDQRAWDRFAAAGLTALMSRTDTAPVSDELCFVAAGVADAMMIERAKRKAGG